MNKLVVLGSVNADHVLQVASFPRPGETLLGHSYAVIPGGKGANQAVAAARLGADIAFIACVGDDSFGRNMITEFARDGMNTQAVMVEQDTPTGIAMIQVAATGENSICISAEANACLTPERLAPHRELITQADTLLMQLETPIATITQVAKIAKQAGTHVVLNPAPAQPLNDALLSVVDLITPNETEAELLTGIKVSDMASAQVAANVLHDKGIAEVMITLGSQGVWMSQTGTGKQVKGFRVDAVDTTAAGDTFNGGLLAGLQAGLILDEAVRFAHAAAALSVTRVGAQTSIPTKAEVDAFLALQD
ncbi:ribokinase [Moritella viscosa]|uniref:ribokinase n=1 Tax=Moritella viscosa TaxID=80854 RepID=UPI0009213782|nr:ribokinase [Moritella viscosa]SHO05147.1 Ribokinase [Moritella viscosa]SHO05158.1 Ribokinase [Moritella viscosa]SHO11983.1 Ribokinase [Moritella viscosa]